MVCLLTVVPWRWSKGLLFATSPCFDSQERASVKWRAATVSNYTSKADPLSTLRPFWRFATANVVLGSWTHSFPLNSGFQEKWNFGKGIVLLGPGWFAEMTKGWERIRPWKHAVPAGNVQGKSEWEGFSLISLALVRKSKNYDLVKRLNFTLVKQ